MSDFRHNLAYRWFRRFGRAVRAAAAGVLALALLSPWAAILVQAQADPCSCGMSCCRSGKGSCHRSGRVHGSGWTAGPQCAQGCGQFAGLPAGPGYSRAAQRVTAFPGWSENLFQGDFPSAHNRTGFAFPLFGRPPPFSC